MLGSLLIAKLNNDRIVSMLLIHSIHVSLFLISKCSVLFLLLLLVFCLFAALASFALPSLIYDELIVENKLTFRQKCSRPCYCFHPVFISIAYFPGNLWRSTSFIFNLISRGKKHNENGIIYLFSKLKNIRHFFSFVHYFSQNKAQKRKSDLGSNKLI